MFRNILRNSFRPAVGLDLLRKAKAKNFRYSTVAEKLVSSQNCTLFNADFSLKSRDESNLLGIMNALHLGDKSRASSLLLGLKGANSTLKAHDFECILELCAKNIDPLFAMETWKVLEDKHINANEACYIFSIRSLCKGGYFKEAFDILSMSGKKYGLMLLPVYNDFLNSCLESQNMQYANQCLDIMEKQTVGKNEVTFTALLKLSVLQENISAVHEIWEEYIKRYNPTILSLRRFIWAFTCLKDFESSRKMLEIMVTLALENNIHVKLSNSGKMSSARPDIPIPSRIDLHWQSCLVENHESSNSSLIQSCSIDSDSLKRPVRIHGRYNGKIENTHAKAILERSFAEVIFACVHSSQDSKVAEELLHQMKALGLKPSKATYDAFIKAVSSGGKYECGLVVLKEMQRKKMVPCETSLASLSISCSKALKLDLAEKLLDKVSAQVGVLPFNVFLASCDALGRPEIALRMLSRMKKMNVQLDRRTYELLFSLFGNLNTLHEEVDIISRDYTLKRIRGIELSLFRSGFQHSYTSMNNLLGALGAEGLKRELIHYLHVAEKLFDQFTHMATLHNVVLQSLVEAKETSAAINIFKNMRKHGFLPNTATYSIMIECCSVDGCYSSALQLLSLMLRDGYRPNTVTYTSLMKVVKDCENFYEELYLLERASTEEWEATGDSGGDVVMYNTVLLKGRDNGRIDIIEFLVERMHQEKIQPNPVTCSIVLDAYTNGGYINTALEALQVLSLRMISLDNEELQNQRPELEDLILSQSPEAESYILEHFNSDANLATALLNLRWCSLIGFSTPWSPDETSWAKTLSTNLSSASAS